MFSTGGEKFSIVKNVYYVLMCNYDVRVVRVNIFGDKMWHRYVRFLEKWYILCSVLRG